MPIRVGRYTLTNRLLMAPMTHSRAKLGGTPGVPAAEYHGQREEVGLIVSERTQPSDDGQDYLTTPGIYTPAHVEGWRKVAAAVHDKGGHIFIQLMHMGRMSHPSKLLDLRNRRGLIEILEPFARKLIGHQLGDAFDVNLRASPGSPSATAFAIASVCP